MDEQKYIELSTFFSIIEWENVPEYERKRYYNMLENYKVMCSFGLMPNRPNFMCKKKRKIGDQECKKPNKHLKFRHPVEIKDENFIRERQNIWQHIPTTEELAKDENEDFLGFSEVDYVGKIVGFAALSKAIKELEDECQMLEKPKNDTEEQLDHSKTRYPKRSVARKDYTEGNVPDDDDYIFCDDCEQEWEGDCPIHGPLKIVDDTKIPADPTDSTRADRTVPPQLCIAQSGINGAGRGVWTRLPLPKGLRFGPYEGEKVESSNSNGYCWQIRHNNRTMHCVDAKDCGLANWMRYVNCARHEEEQNLMAFQYKGEMYYRTFRDIPAHVELLVWYGDEYGRELGIDVENYHKPQQKQYHGVFKCYGCGITYASPLYLEKHRRHCRGAKVPRSPEDRKVSIKHNTSNYLNQNSQQKVYMIKSPNKNVSVCEVSDTKSTCNLDSIIHIGRMHHSEQELSTQQSVVTYMKRDTTKKQFKCEVCSYESAQRTDLIRHMRTHTGDKPFKCEVCGYASAHRSALIYHMRTHTGDKPFKCEVCGYASAQRSYLIIHMRTHTGDKPFKCEVCSYASAQRSHLTDHMRTHTGDKPFKCEVCSYASAQRSHLTDHMRTHTGDKPFKCEVCGYASAHRSALIYHMRTHTGDKPFKCEVCGYASAHRSALIYHMRTHTGDKPFKCEVCSYASAQRSDLITHMRTHTGDKPFKCEVCGYASARRSALIYHMRTHTGDKPFKCEVCGYASAHRSALIYHMRTHTGDKPFKCEVCSYASAQRTHLITHMRTHTGDKPFKCEVCSYASARRTNLITHIRTHTANKLSRTVRYEAEE